MNSQRLTWLLVGLNLLVAYLLYDAFNLEYKLHGSTGFTDMNAQKLHAISNFSRETNINFSEITARPLFNEDRLPLHSEDAVDTPAMASDGNAAAFKLVGTVLLPEVSQALLQKKDRKIEKVQLGEEIDGWELKSVEEDHVVLVKGVKNIQLVLERKSKAQPSLKKRRAIIKRKPGKPGNTDR